MSRHLISSAVLGLWVVAACSNTVPPCFENSTVCDNTCANLMADQANCGACGNVCGVGSSCEAGVCTLSCSPGLSACGDTCRDLAHDAENCGTCGNVCGPAEACGAGTCATLEWEPLATIPGYISLTDYTPAGQTSTFTYLDVTLSSYSFPTSTDPLGTFTARAAPPALLNEYGALAWSGSALYQMQQALVFKYDPALDMWSMPNNTLAHALDQAAVSADDNGIVYGWATDQYLIAFNPADSSASYVMGPPDLTHLEPRAAWDSASKRLYLADYGGVKLYAYNPVDQSFTSLPVLPSGGQFSDAFCSDRKGHLFTTIAGDDGSHAVWMYSTTTALWTQTVRLPWDFQSAPACSVSADGYLYLANGEIGGVQQFARLDLGFNHVTPQQ